METANSFVVTRADLQLIVRKLNRQLWAIRLLALAVALLGFAFYAHVSWGWS